MANITHPEQQLLDLSGKVAVITGGSRGLGRQMADAFARAGADIMIASRKLDACETAAAEIAEATGRTVHAQKCHVGDWADCDALFVAAYGRFQRCDILVNNAGMSPLYDKLTNVSEALYDKVLAVNLKGPFRLSALFGEQMAADGGGSIINVSSVASLEPSPNEAAYGAAKAGLNALTQSFSRAYAPHVRVNTLMPGPFGTDIADAWTDEVKDRISRNVPLGRIGEPHEVVGAAMFLASDAGSYTTGSTIKIDGGAAWG